MSRNAKIKISEIVEEIMKNSLESRNSDSMLYAMVCEKLNDNVKKYSFSDVMRNRIYFGLPDYETVRRCRCKIVAKHKELSCLPGVRTKTGKKHKPYIDYAKI